MKVLQEDKQQVLTAFLKDAIVFTHAQKGLLQLYDREREVLEVVAQVGFGEEFLTLFKTVKAFDPSACGRAIGLKVPITIDDVTRETAFVPFIKVIEKEGFRSVRAIPLFDENHMIVGVISTHFDSPQYLLDKKGRIPETHLTELVRFLRSGLGD